ncbi:MAG: hypothetical protein KDD70_01560 [Bdellovibrionales bacterium]|nr:hypothetical protein [Bdellovibrionales bacterium]
MSRQSLFDRYEPFVAAAILGAHANTRSAGFRQYDVRYMLEIFTNWVSSAEGQSSLPIQNNQIARYLNALVEEDFATSLGDGRKLRYRLTRRGLLEVITRFVTKAHYNPREHFYFVLSFADMYAGRMIDFVKEEGARFPNSLRLELEALLDPASILNRQIEEVKHELYLLDKRIKDIQKIEALVNKRLGEGVSYENITAEVDRIGFFGFSTQLRFTEVFEMSTVKQGIWEMICGNLLREKLLWEPCRAILLSHLDQLEILKNSREGILGQFGRIWKDHEAFIAKRERKKN